MLYLGRLDLENWTRLDLLVQLRLYLGRLDLANWARLDLPVELRIILLAL